MSCSKTTPTYHLNVKLEQNVINEFPFFSFRVKVIPSWKDLWLWVFSSGASVQIWWVLTDYCRKEKMILPKTRHMHSLPFPSLGPSSPAMTSCRVLSRFVLNKRRKTKGQNKCSGSKQKKQTVVTISEHFIRNSSTQRLGFDITTTTATTVWSRKKLKPAKMKA